MVRFLTAFLVVGAFAFSGCGMFQKKAKDKPATAQAKKDQQTTEDNADVDFQGFLNRLRKAVEARDMNSVAAMMTTDFAYVMGSSAEQDRKGEGVFQFWDENGLWPELEGILSEKFVKKEDFMVAPPQFANPAISYDGYRAGIRRVNGSWKFAYFVNG
jgi:hypothetical protein